MIQKVLLVVLVFAGLFALGSSRSDTELGRYQLVCGTVRYDVSTTVAQGLKEQGQERYEDRPACFKIDTQTGQTWVYHNDIDISTNASGRTRQSTYEGFKLLQQ